MRPRGKFLNTLEVKWETQFLSGTSPNLFDRVLRCDAVKAHMTRRSCAERLSHVSEENGVRHCARRALALLKALVLFTFRAVVHHACRGPRMVGVLSLGLQRPIQILSLSKHDYIKYKFND